VVTFTCRGHPNITATHAKTLEFTRDGEIGRRATCVLGVASDHDDRALLAVRGDVRVTLESSGVRDTFDATMTPFFLGDDSLVFRVGPALRGRTIAADASKGAADVDRALVHALASRDAELCVTIEEADRSPARGALFVVAVPIGNDDDLSPRARKALEAADLVLAEDTRRFRDLVQRTAMHVEARVVSYHEQNENVRADEALHALAEGARVALVSDAGTPLASDPGYVLVHSAVEQGYDVSPIPGPASVLAVVSASGLSVDRFTYVGFLPRRSAARRAALRALVDHATTFVCHEAPHRVDAFLADLAAVAPEWDVCMGREVTKVFEESRRGKAGDLVAGEARGEYTFVIAPPPASGAPSDAPAIDVDRLVRALLDEGVTARTVSHALATLPGMSRKEAYARVLAIAERT
jgi:16S rRNA (cytidine1402-2'-O)-methyltransferase